jgi:hypothetical protein
MHAGPKAAVDSSSLIFRSLPRKVHGHSAPQLPVGAVILSQVSAQLQLASP